MISFLKNSLPYHYILFYAWFCTFYYLQTFIIVTASAEITVSFADNHIQGSNNFKRNPQKLISKYNETNFKGFWWNNCRCSSSSTFLIPPPSLFSLICWILTNCAFILCVFKQTARFCILLSGSIALQIRNGLALSLLLSHRRHDITQAVQVSEVLPWLIGCSYSLHIITGKSLDMH